MFTRFAEMTRAMTVLIRTVSSPTAVSSTLYLSMIARYSTSITMFTSTGASCPMRLRAMVSLASWRCCRSPTMRCA